jgi:uncharacterized protein
METKKLNLSFEIKEITDEGVFEGFASVYNVVDEGGDVVEKGAFTRTIKALQSKSDPSVPILWRHDSPIGKGTVEDTDRGLIIRGKLTLAVNQAKEALALAKDGVVKGLSIGFITVRDEVKNGIRYLKEVRLMEVSLTPFPMNPQAQVTAVKEDRTMQKEQKDFNSELDAEQIYSGGYMMMSALRESLYKCMTMDGEVSARTAEAGKCIDQFKEQYLEWFPKYVALLQQMYGMKESKEGRKISASTRAAIEGVMADHQAVMTKLQALLDDGSSEKEEKQTAPEPAEPISDPAACHSEAAVSIDAMLALIPRA